LPIPISTPGWDIAPFTTLSQYITKDPDSGVQNMGIYRGQVKAPRKLGMNPSLELRPGIYVHWEKMKRRGKKLPAAVVLGAPPCVAFASAQKVPEALDELHVAGALVGAPINVVKAKTVDLLVPAEAEIVVEGLIDTQYLEPEAPFGESHGHVNLQEYNAFMEVTCITRRRDAILTSIISQVTPSESSLIKRVALEPLFTSYLRDTLAIRGVKRVSMHEPLTNLRKVVVLILEKDTPRTEIWRALYGAVAWNRAAGKYVIAVNDDIDPDDANALLWAMSYRANPALDMQILPHRDQGHGPRSKRNNGEDASVLIDATMKEAFPPISLPKREYMERAKAIWEELGLPKLKPEAPWYGYSLGEWPDELERAAELAVKGEYFETGKLLAERKRKDVGMNTEVRDLSRKQESDE
jgi:4-hydroxy-3-polyprenylbenzoate decarboxylase